MLYSLKFYVNGNSSSVDVTMRCPLCGRYSHLMIDGKENVDAVTDYMSRGLLAKTQDLPFVASEREFLRSGYCKKHLSMFGEPSKNIRYVEKTCLIGKE